MKLYGAILGDLAGQPYEFNYKGDYSEFDIHDKKSHFTDDTLMTLASASYLLDKFDSLEDAFKDMGKRYEGNYYGKTFKKWLQSYNGTIGNSYGNGCLMRVSPFMYCENSLEKAIESCFCSHLHSKSIIGVVNLYELYQHSKIRKIASKYKPENHILYAKNKFIIEADETSKLIEHLYWLSESTHETIEKTIKLGGDTDTNASIIAELMNYTFQDLNIKDVEYVESKLDDYLLSILKEFNEKF